MIVKKSYPYRWRCLRACAYWLRSCRGTAYHSSTSRAFCEQDKIVDKRLESAYRNTFLCVVRCLFFFHSSFLLFFIGSRRVEKKSPRIYAKAYIYMFCCIHIIHVKCNVFLFLMILSWMWQGWMHMGLYLCWCHIFFSWFCWKAALGLLEYTIWILYSSCRWLLLLPIGFIICKLLIPNRMFYYVCLLGHVCVRVLCVFFVRYFLLLIFRRLVVIFLLLFRCLAVGFPFAFMYRIVNYEEHSRYVKTKSSSVLLNVVIINII